MTDEPDRAWMRLCADTLLPLLDAMEEEADGARRQEDVENVHRMRVASRRARAALEAFRDCFPRKRLRSYRRTMRGLTRALGAARDADVQIEFLRELQGRCPKRAQPGVAFVLELKQAQRQELQGPLLRTLDRLRKEGALQDLRSYLEDLRSTDKDGGGAPRSPFAFAAANALVRERIEELVSHQGSVHREEAQDEHHAMRISAKRLRYALEILRPLFDDQLKEEISLVKRMQELLGDVHDCDVWTADMQASQDALAQGALVLPGGVRAASLAPGLQLILQDRASRRRQAFQEFASLWQRAQEDRAFDVLQNRLEAASGAMADLTTMALEAVTADPGTRLAVLGDVHGNLHALRAVLQDAEAKGAKVVLHTGDVLGPFPFPEECVRLLRSRPSISVAGNFDMRALRAMDGKGGEGEMGRLLAELMRSSRGISAPSREWALALPKEVRLRTNGREVLLVHGSPDSITEHLSPDTSEARLRQIAAASGADIVISGHSHRPMYRREGRTAFLNPGSVGRQSDGDPRASYALLRLRPLQVRLVRVPYDVDGAMEAVRDAGLPQSLADTLRLGRPQVEAIPPDGEEARFQQVRELYVAHLGEDSHTEQVVRLSVELFDCLAERMHLGPKERFLLRCAAALHDIGWTEGRKGHHKASMRMVMEEEDLPLDQKERRMVAAVARYHRKALPERRHELVSSMGGRERRRMCCLAAILRLADALDSTHAGRVRRLRCQIEDDRLVLHCGATGRTEMEDMDARQKADLLQRVLGLSLEIHWEVA